MEVRSFLFQPLGRKNFPFVISAQEVGLFVGREVLLRAAGGLGADVEWAAVEGTAVQPGDIILRGRGGAEQVVGAEEKLLGLIGKPSGVATAAAGFVHRADGQIRVVCGAWKKILPAIRPELRQAAALGGVGIRISDQPFIYLDKNYVRLFGGVGPAVVRAREFGADRLVVVQLRGEKGPVEQEAAEAVNAGAGLLMIDTGNVAHLRAVVAEARKGRWREKVSLAFAGGVTLEQLPAVIAAGADVVDVGRAIIDAPLLDFRLDVEV